MGTEKTHFLGSLCLFFLLLHSSSSLSVDAMPGMSTGSTTMKAVLVSKFGQPDDVMTVGETSKPQPNEKRLLVKVKACSLTPGDYRALLGDKPVVSNPKAWPYVPGGDVSGIVEHVPKDCEEEFQVGQKVVATWDIWGEGGMAEYTQTIPKKTVPLPEGMTFVEGSALANSASHALLVIDRADIKEGDRVLVIGASGGIGTLAVQLAKNQCGASYVGAVTTDDKLMERLGVVDKTVNYKEQNWWEDDEWKTNKFDVVLDLAVGVEAYNKAPSVVKGAREGGRWVAVVMNEWHLHIESFFGIFGMLLPPLGRQLRNIFRRRTPKYRMYLGSPTQETMNKALKMASAKEFVTTIDPKSPHPFTTEGVRDAWNHHIARAGHGKIVVQVAED